MIAKHNVESKLLSILDSLKHPQNASIKDFTSFRFVRKALRSKRAMQRFYDLMINDVRHVKQRIEDKALIDAGCGCGMFSVLLSLLGARKVLAVDYVSDCVAMTQTIVRLANIHNIEVIHSDVAKIQLPEQSIDGIFSIEGLSHYRNHKAFLAMASRMLKDEGFLFIRDGNNKASPFVRKRNFRIWYLYENYPDPITICGFEKNRGCYLDKRKEIIKSAFPALNDEKVQQFARYTFGCSKEEIILAVNQFTKGNFALKSEYSPNVCPLNPEIDCYMENMFNPVELKHRLMNNDFKVRIIARGPSSRKLRLLRFVWELCSPLTIFLPGGFHLLAIKSVR